MPTQHVPPLANRMAIRSPTGAPNPCAACPVRDMTVCAGLKPHELDRMNAIVTRMRIDPERAVFFEWDSAEHVFNVTGGTVRLSKMLPDGRRQVTGFLYPGDFLGTLTECLPGFDLALGSDLDGVVREIHRLLALPEAVDAATGQGPGATDSAP